MGGIRRNKRRQQNDKRKRDPNDWNAGPGKGQTNSFLISFHFVSHFIRKLELLMDESKLQKIT